MMWNRNVDTKCILFLCSYSLKVWEELMRGVLLDKFSVNWREILKLTNDNNFDKTKAFILRYMFQNTIHSVW